MLKKGPFNRFVYAGNPAATFRFLRSIGVRMTGSNFRECDMTLLHYVFRPDVSEAILSVWPEVIQDLVDLGLDVNAQEKCGGRTPMHMLLTAIEVLTTSLGTYSDNYGPVGRKALSELLRLGGNPNALDFDGETPLHDAVTYGNKHAVSTLLAHGADPKVMNFGRDTPLKTAAVSNR